MVQFGNAQRHSATHLNHIRITWEVPVASGELRRKEFWKTQRWP